MTWAESVLQRLTHPSKTVESRVEAVEVPGLGVWRADVPAAIVVFLVAEEQIRPRSWQETIIVKRSEERQSVVADSGIF